VFPKPPDFSKIPAFDLQFFASHPRFTLFLITLFGVATLVGFAVVSARVRAFSEQRGLSAGALSPQARMLTARATTSPMVSSEARAWIVISTLAIRDRGIVSVGLNAVALVKDT
jgi:hypothetical protein